MSTMVLNRICPNERMIVTTEIRIVDIGCVRCGELMQYSYVLNYKDYCRTCYEVVQE